MRLRRVRLFDDLAGCLLVADGCATAEQFALKVHLLNLSNSAPCAYRKSHPQRNRPESRCESFVRATVPPAASRSTKNPGRRLANRIEVWSPRVARIGTRWWIEIARLCSGGAPVSPWIRGAPQRVLAAHAADQFSHIRRNRWSSRLPAADLPSPEQSEAFAVPANHGFWLDNDQHRAPVAPKLGKPRPQKPVCRGQLRALHRALQYRELMPESEHFNLKSCAAPK